MAKCVVCGIEYEGGKDFICEICGIPETTTLYCDRCRQYTYVPASDFFNSSFGQHLREDGFDLTGPESCNGLIIKSIGGCTCCENEGTMSIFRMRSF